MEFINVGSGNLVSVARIVSVVSPDAAPIKRLVGLGATRTHRRAFRSVQPFHLNAGFVDTSCHFAAKRADFSHQMTFSRAADAWVTWHQSNRRQVHGQQQSISAKSCAGQRGFAAGMPAAHHNDIKAERHRDYFLTVKVP